MDAIAGAIKYNIVDRGYSATKCDFERTPTPQNGEPINLDGIIESLQPVEANIASMFNNVRAPEKRRLLADKIHHFAQRFDAHRQERKGFQTVWLEIMVDNKYDEDYAIAMLNRLLSLLRSKNKLFISKKELDPENFSSEAAACLAVTAVFRGDFSASTMQMLQKVAESNVEYQCNDQLVNEIVKYIHSAKKDFRGHVSLPKDLNGKDEPAKYVYHANGDPVERDGCKGKKYFFPCGAPIRVHLSVGKVSDWCRPRAIGTGGWFDFSDSFSFVYRVYIRASSDPFSSERHLAYRLVASGERRESLFDFFARTAVETAFFFPLIITDKMQGMEDLRVVLANALDQEVSQGKVHNCVKSHLRKTYQQLVGC